MLKLASSQILVKSTSLKLKVHNSVSFENIISNDSVQFSMHFPKQRIISRWKAKSNNQKRRIGKNGFVFENSILINSIFREVNKKLGIKFKRKLFCKGTKTGVSVLGGISGDKILNIRKVSR